MTGVDEILNYQRSPDDDFYGLLGCDENSTVSISTFYFLCSIYDQLVLIFFAPLFDLYLRPQILTYILVLFAKNCIAIKVYLRFPLTSKSLLIRNLF